METLLEFEIEEDIAFFKTLRDVSDYERERGKPMPSRNHSIAQAELIFLLKSTFRKQYSILSESSITLNTRKYTPDITIYPIIPIDWKHDEISLTEPPLTTIEILSPTQTLTTLIDKSEDYFSGGVKSCWVVMPLLETILVIHANRSKVYYQRGDTLNDAATGITLDVDAVFAE